MFYNLLPLEVFSLKYEIWNIKQVRSEHEVDFSFFFRPPIILFPQPRRKITKDTFSNFRFLYNKHTTKVKKVEKIKLLRRTHCLQLSQLPINPPLLNEILMSSALNNLAIVENVNKIGMLNSTQTMRDSDGSAAFGCSI